VSIPGLVCGPHGAFSGGPTERIKFSWRALNSRAHLD
jgi:hypothetical protein